MFGNVHYRVLSREHACSQSVGIFRVRWHVHDQVSERKRSGVGERGRQYLGASGKELSPQWGDLRHVPYVFHHHVVFNAMVLDFVPLGKMFCVMNTTLSLRWWHPWVNNNSMSTFCTTQCIKSSNTISRWRLSAVNSSMTFPFLRTAVGECGNSTWSRSEGLRRTCPWRSAIIGRRTGSFHFPFVRSRTYCCKVRRETPWFESARSFFFSYGLATFNVGLGRAYPMALLSKVIHSSFFPFCSDRLTIDVTMMT